MVPLILLSVLAVVLVVAVLAVASGRVEVDPLAEAVRSTPDHGLPPAPRAAEIAARAMPTPRTSVNMCPASDSRANDDVARPTTTSIARKASRTPSDIHNRRTCRPPALASLGRPCPCPAPTAALYMRARA